MVIDMVQAYHKATLDNKRFKDEALHKSASDNDRAKDENIEKVTSGNGQSKEEPTINIHAWYKQEMVGSYYYVEDRGQGMLKFTSEWSQANSPTRS
jgi:hypothetical protein